MNIRPLYFFIFSAFSVFGQNLVPNPGFEQNLNGMVTFWTQPLGGFYHYSAGNSVEGYAREGSYYNALCLLNRSGSEYLQVPLKEPLQAGKEYILSFYTRPGGNKTVDWRRVKSIDWHFPSGEQNVKGRMHIKLKPDVRFPFQDSLIWGKWIYMERRYVAKGGERLLLIGKFFDEEDSVNQVIAEMNKRVSVLRAEHKKAVKKGTDSISAWYKSQLVYHSKKRNKKQEEDFRKLLRQQNAETLKYRKAKQNELTQREQEIQKEYNLVNYYYDCRFHFDMISVVPVGGKNGTTITPPVTGIPKEPVKGLRFTLENILFESGKSVLKPESSVSLDQLVVFLKSKPGISLQVTGHTDNVGSAEANQLLSGQRANAVRDYLIVHGISPDRLSAFGLGSTHPIAGNDSPSGRQKNRRVEFEVK
ncbi:MAG: OmpA family protein [Bacteroidia bacterium]|nr:OmpA family protein [Bacteroidia bacterium]